MRATPSRPTPPGRGRPGDEVHILKLSGAGHFDPIAPGALAWARVEAFIADRALN